jgi:Cu-Zn family superoxide dismutase
VRTTTVFALIAIATSGCAGMQTSGPRAVATLEPRSGSTVGGKAEFRQTSHGVRAHVELAGLAPGSEHGFHVHEKGDCSAPDGASAGGHFNPTGVAHGRASATPHHLGDMPSVVADASGRVRATFELAGLTLDSGPNSIVGRSVVLHGGVDDFTTQPSGNSGPRIACGVIGTK